MNWSQIINSLFEELRKEQVFLEEDGLYSFAGMIESLRYSYKIYNENLYEFKSYATDENLPPLSLPLNDKKASIDNARFLITLSRKLFNVVASANMYVEHSVTVKNKICKAYPSYKNEYSQCVASKIKDNDMFSFMKDLRNYFSHYGIATFSIVNKIKPRFTSVEEIFQRELHLDVNKLVKWSGWKKPSRRYLESCAGGFSFYTTIEEFDVLLKKTYELFATSFKRHFSEDLKKTYGSVERHNKIRRLLDKLAKHNKQQ